MEKSFEAGPPAQYYGPENQVPPTKPLIPDGCAGVYDPENLGRVRTTDGRIVTPGHVILKGDDFGQPNPHDPYVDYLTYL